MQQHLSGNAEGLEDGCFPAHRAVKEAGGFCRDWQYVTSASVQLQETNVGFLDVRMK